MFYGQLLHMQIPKAQKKTDNLTVFLTLSGPGVNFNNVLHRAFTHVDPERAKKDSQVIIVILRFWAPQA